MAAMDRSGTIAVNGFEMYVEERGDGPPLLFLHGGTGIGADWKHVFTDGDPVGFRVIVPDLRGHGRSTNPGAFTFRQVAKDVIALLDHLGIPRVCAIGLSAGAKTLLHVATQQPDRVEAMVLVSATPYFPAQVRAAMAQLSVDAFSESDWAAQRQRHVHGDGQIRMLFAQMRALKDSHDDMAFTPPLLATITARTLIVHGDRDPLYPVELALEMYRAIPTSALWVVPNGDHGPIFGPRAPLFRETAMAFLTSP
ncbi:MAG: alpha/beta hydrolase [Proteobacteria bacterium]|nr:alpha/beta hydrolase [Pseudomonadota bacterium]